jgi:hypothetical protein
MQIHEVFEFVLDDCELEISAVEAVFDSPPFNMPADPSNGEAASAATADVVAAAEPTFEPVTGSPPLAPNMQTEIPETAAQPRSPPSKGSASAATTTRVELEKDRSRGQHGRRVGYRAGDAWPGGSFPAGGDQQPARSSP